MSPSAPRPLPTYDGAWNLGARFGISDSDAQLLYFAGSILLALALAAITAYYARQNRRMVEELRLQRAEAARQTQELVRQNRIHLYERRAAILRGVSRCFGLIFRDGRVGDEVIPGLLEATSEKEYLLDPALCGYLDEIYRKSVRTYTNQLEWKDLPVGERRTKLVHEHAELLLWLTEQPVELRQRFLPYLRVEE